MARLLVVDDEIKIREMISKYASHEGYDVSLASCGKEAIELFSKEDFDVVILDVMMPDISGYETLKRMKEIKEVHCIFLTALGQEYDKIYGFDLGAEDYVTKPFSLKELMMRIKVILKRNNNNEITEKIVVDKLVIDLNGHIVSIDNQEVRLPNKEYELLLCLVKNRGKALSREYLINSVWRGV